MSQTVSEVTNRETRLSDRDFLRLTQLIEAQCGIRIAPAKRVMIETRLRRRLHKLNLGSFGAYCDFLYSADGKQREWPHFIDTVTTHKTDFFREPAHFDLLLERILPELARAGVGARRSLIAWSAACSTGEEPYTLAMVLSSYAESVAPRFLFRIEASDVSAPVLETARHAVYPAANVEAIPLELRRKFLLRSRQRNHAVVRMSPEIRAAVHFRQLNLVEGNFGFTDPFDLVLCRNVMIYFERAVQQRVVHRIRQAMRIGGYLLMGHSESLNGLETHLEQVAPTVYRRIE